MLVFFIEMLINSQLKNPFLSFGYIASSQMPRFCFVKKIKALYFVVLGWKNMAAMS